VLRDLAPAAIQSLRTALYDCAHSLEATSGRLRRRSTSRR
jgi:hypothetical protein